MNLLKNADLGEKLYYSETQSFFITNKKWIKKL